MASYLYIGAHPDDAEVHFGGTARKLVKRGHRVGFLSLTDGRMGHQEMAPEELAARRRLEAAAAARVLGLAQSDIFDNPDCGLEPTLKNRYALIAYIRKFAPDVVIGPRLCDYHPDHRATAQLITDAAFLLIVPHCVPEVPAPMRAPVFAYSFDHFQTPNPSRCDAVIDIRETLEDRISALQCHRSQFLEWLPYTFGDAEFIRTPHTDAEERGWIRAHWPDWGPEPGTEGFEISEYGSPIARGDFQKLMEGAL